MKVGERVANPDTKVRILRKVPLTSDYNDVIWFVKSGETGVDSENIRIRQRDFFLQYSFPEATWDDFTFQRVESGQIQVPLYYEELDGCNYIMIQNTQKNTRWYYGFIDKIEYVNNGSCIINYTLDVFQCYQENIRFQEAFVERCHSQTDTFGENRVDENLELGPMIYATVNKLPWPPDIAFKKLELLDTDEQQHYEYINWNVVVQFAESIKNRPINIINLLPSGIRYSVFNNTRSLRNVLNELQNLDSVIGMFLCPQEASDYIKDAKGVNIINPEPVSKEFHVNRRNIFGSYIPHNKKLLQYPYNYVTLSNGMGGNIDLKFEDSYYQNDRGDHDQFYYTVYMCADANDSCYLVPNTGGTARNEVPWTSYSLSLPSWPQCSLSTDTYKAWLAMNQGALQSTTTQNISSLVGTATSMLGYSATGNVIGAGAATVNFGMGVFQRAMSQSQRLRDVQSLPNKINGDNINNLLLSTNNFHFYEYYNQITEESARRLDGFFDMFGYAQNKVMKINVLARPRYTFIKTAGCNVQTTATTQSLPDWQRKMINTLMDRGVRFWKYDQIGTPDSPTIAIFSGNEV